METIEWSDKNKYNEFNSYKGLTYYPQYRRIVDWLQGGKDYDLPPIECSFDPIAVCNLDCYWCNSQRYLKGEELTNKFMPYDHMVRMVNHLAEWGVRGFCFGGGGESMLSKDAWALPLLVKEKGMHPAIITNGTMMNDTILKSMLSCQWVAFSVDAATKETFKANKGVDLFDAEIAHIRALVDAKRKTGSRVKIAYRFLLCAENQDEIYDACQIAKKLGVDSFHVRPVDLQRKDYKGKSNFIDVDKPTYQFVKCHDLEDEHFRVHTVTHKFDSNFRVVHNFKKCMAAPICLQACTDGNCYVCPDHRLEPRFLLGSQSNINKWWGKDAHRDLLNSIDPHTECARCTWSEYNRQIEQVVIEGKMNEAFP